MILYSVITDARKHGRLRRVSVTNTLVGWAVVLLLLAWGGFFR